jgi:RND family efflux transporter MFP subunit
MSTDKSALDALRLDKDAVASSAGRHAAPWITAAVALLIGAVGTVAWWSLRTPAIEVATLVVQPTTATGGSTSGSAVLSATGYVVARRISTPSSKITAQIVAVFIEEGMAVKEGDVLAQLDDTTPVRQLALAESQLESARRAEAELRVRLDEAERTQRRTRSLFEQKLVAEAAVDGANAEVNALRARIEVTRSEADVAARSVALATQQVEDTVIRAPFSGVVVSKDAQPGEMISPISAGGGFTRTGICTIVDMESLEIEVDVNEAFINRVRDGQRVEAVLDAYPDWRIPAHVISIVPTADRQKATVRVRVGFDQRDPRILPDMGVQVQFMEAPKTPGNAPAAAALWIPETALRSENGKDYLFVVSGERAERRAVGLGARTRGNVQVAAGLAAGERIVAQPPPELADGAAVRVRE